MANERSMPVPPLPDDWQEQLAKQAADAAAGEQAVSQYISLKGGVMTFQGTTIPGNKLKVVILDSVFERSYYAEAWSPNEISPPVCFAVGRNEKALAPHNNSEKKQHSDCAGCDLSQWGSDPKGGKGQACKMRRRLAMIGADVLAGGNAAIMNADAFGIRVPPTSLRYWATFVSQVANVVKRPPYGVVAEISCKPHAAHQFEFGVEYVDVIPEALLPAVIAKRTQLGDTFMAPWQSATERAAQSEQEKKAKEAEKKTAAARARKY